MFEPDWDVKNEIAVVGLGKLGQSAVSSLDRDIFVENDNNIAINIYAENELTWSENIFLLYIIADTDSSLQKVLALAEKAKSHGIKVILLLYPKVEIGYWAINSIKEATDVCVLLRSNKLHDIHGILSLWIALRCWNGLIHWDGMGGDFTCEEFHHMDIADIVFIQSYYHSENVLLPQLLTQLPNLDKAAAVLVMIGYGNERGYTHEYHRKFIEEIEPFIEPNASFQVIPIPMPIHNNHTKMMIITGH